MALEAGKTGADGVEAPQPPLQGRHTVVQQDWNVDQQSLWPAIGLLAETRRMRVSRRAGLSLSFSLSVATERQEQKQSEADKERKRGKEEGGGEQENAPAGTTTQGRLKPT